MRNIFFSFCAITLASAISMSALSAELIASNNFTKSGCSWNRVHSGSAGPNQSVTVDALICTDNNSSIATKVQYTPNGSCTISNLAAGYTLDGSSCDYFFISSTQSFQKPSDPTAGEILVGTWDLDGSGNMQHVYSSVERENLAIIRVVDVNGINSYKYSIQVVGLRASWILMGTEDVDGKPGKELILSSTYENNKTRVQIVAHKSRSIINYSINTAATDYSWQLLNGGIVDTDRNPGKELILNVVNRVDTGNGFHQRYRFVSFYEGYPTVYTHEFNQDEKIELLGITNTLLEKEQVVVKRGSSIDIIDASERSSKRYYLNSSSFSLIGFSDLNERRGNEIIVRDGNDLVAIINIANEKKTFYPRSNWAFDSFSNIDGYPGNEILIRANGVLENFVVGPWCGRGYGVVYDPYADSCIYVGIIPYL